MPHGFVILTAKPIAGHHAKGQRREPGQDDPDAAGAQELDPDRRQAPARIIGVPRSRQTAMPENAAAESTATAQAATTQQ
jgi:hypothetical protein